MKVDTTKTIAWRQPFRSATLLAIFLALLAFAHSVQLVGPLRLNTDAVTTLSMALSNAEGHGFLEDGAPTVISPGYPWLLSILLQLGFVSSAGLVALNFICLIVGLLCVVLVIHPKLGLDRGQSLLLVCLTLCSWVVIKHVPIPLTDIPFFALSLLSVALMEKARNNASDRAAVAWFILSWMAVLAAIATRRIGIALLPALIWAIAGRWKSIAPSWSWKEWFVSLSSVLCASAITLAWTKSLVTLGDTPSLGTAGAGIKLLINNMEFRALEFGEISLNFPATKAPFWLRPLFLVVGTAAFVLMISGLFVRKSLDPIDVYVAAYVCIMLGWPYPDSRFWIPVLPLVLTYWLIWLTHRAETWRHLCALCFVCLYVFAGLGALVYSSQISLAGNRFPDRYGDGYLRSTYCVFLKACGENLVIDEHDKALKLLRVFSQRQ
jgi:hypothetical protein